MNKIKLSNDIIHFLEDFEETFKIRPYLVGGCIRDLLMGIRCNDYDIAVDIDFNKLQPFKQYSMFKINDKHDTVSFYTRHTSLLVDVSNYKSNDHNIENDLLERDLTINSIGYDYKLDKIIDPSNGISDIQNRIIRVIDPFKKFEDSPARIIRCLRFASIFGFSIEDKTHEAIFDNSDLLFNIPAELIFKEFNKILCAKYNSKIFINYDDIFTKLIPELKPFLALIMSSRTRMLNKYDYSVYTTYFSPNDISIKWATLLQFLSNDQINNIADRFLFDNNTKREVIILVNNISKILNKTNKINRIQLKYLLHDYGDKMLIKLLQFARAKIMADTDAIISMEEIDNIENIFHNIKYNKDVINLDQMDINGDDLIKLGYIGVDIGKRLNFLLNNIIEEKVENQKDKLISYLNDNYK